MLTYLFLVTLSWAFFALLYYSLLRKETFFYSNRVFLLGAVFLGLVLPLADGLYPTLYVDENPLSVVLPMLTIGLQQAEQTASQWSSLTYFWWIYVTGLLLTAMRMFWGIAKIIQMAVRNKGERLSDSSVLIRTSEARLPFSFFNWIFVPADFDERADCRNMLAHERAHVHSWHSIDVLLMELLCVVLWFHPLIHWYRRSLRTVHEYQADQEASNHTNRKQYGMLLLQQTQTGYALAFANHFFQSPLKQRLLMLTQTSSPMVRGWKYGLALPIVIFSIFISQAEPPQTKLSDTAPKTSQLQQNPSYPGGVQALVKYLSDNIKYPKRAQADEVEGKVLIELVIDASGKISKVQAAPKQVLEQSIYHQGMIAEAVRVVEKMPDWMPAERNGVPIACKISLPIQFKLED